MEDRHRNLLFGVFAVQLGKVSAQQLAHAAVLWAQDPSQPLAQYLLEGKHLPPEEVRLLGRLVDEAVSVCNGDSEATLRVFGGEDQVQHSFAGAITLTDSGGVATVPLTVALQEEQRLDSVPGVSEVPGRYTLRSEHARGGMGRVLLVHDEHMGRDIALKELLPELLEGSGADKETPVRKSMPIMARFLQEALITGQLEHPAIVPVYELGNRANGTIYYTMKLVRGQSLSQALRAVEDLPQRLELLPHFVDLCNAIAYAHSRNVIHRDIKPGNVMVGEFGETVVLDWGLAKVRDREDVHADELTDTFHALNLGEQVDFAKTRYGQALGTPAYMPPEQAKGAIDEVDERSDVYSLGAVLYELLTGQPPHQADSIREILRRVVETSPEPPESLDKRVPAELSAICMRALAPEPGDRYQSARDIATEIERFRSGAMVAAYSYSLREVVGRFVRKHKIALSGAAAVFATIVISVTAFVLFLQQSNRELEASLQRESEMREEAENAKEVAQEQTEAAEAARQASDKARADAERQAYLSSILAARSMLAENKASLAKKTLLSAPENSREIEWPYYLLQTDESIATLGDGTTPLVYAAFTEYPQVILVSETGVVQTWNARTQERTSEFETMMPVTHAALSPDRKRIALCHVVDANLQVWSLEDNTLLFNRSEERAQSREIYIDRIRFGPLQWLADSNSIVCRYLVEPGMAAERVDYALVNIDANQVVETLDDALVSPNGAYITCRREDEHSHGILRGGSWQPLRGSPLLFSPDSKVLLTNAGSDLVVVYDLESGQEREFTWNERCISSAWASEAGFWIAMNGCDSPGDRIVFIPSSMTESDVSEIYFGSFANAPGSPSFEFASGPFLLEQRHALDGTNFSGVHYLPELTPDSDRIWGPAGTWTREAELLHLRGHSAPIAAFAYDGDNSSAPGFRYFGPLERPTLQDIEARDLLLTASMDGTAKLWFAYEDSISKGLYKMPEEVAKLYAYADLLDTPRRESGDLTFLLGEVPGELEKQYSYSGQWESMKKMTYWKAVSRAVPDRLTLGRALPPLREPPEVCVASNKGLFLDASTWRLRCLDLSDGEDVWAFGTEEDIILSSRLSPDGSFAVVSMLDSVYALDGHDGQVLWRGEFPDVFSVSVNANSTRLLICDGSMHIYLIDTTTWMEVARVQLYEGIGIGAQDPSAHFSEGESGTERVDIVELNESLTWDPWRDISPGDLLEQTDNKGMEETQASEAATASAESKFTEVSTVEEFIDAIRAGRDVRLAPGDYVLSEENLGTDPEVFSWRYGPTLRDTSGLTILGSEAGVARILIEDENCAVLALENCTNLAMKNVTFGHLGSPGGCYAPVIHAKSCQGLAFRRCDLFGSGMVAVSLEDSEFAEFRECSLRDCTNQAVYATDCGTVLFDQCVIRDNYCLWPGLYFERVADARLVACMIHGNQTRAEDGEPLIEGKQSEVHLDSCAIWDNTGLTLPDQDAADWLEMTDVAFAKPAAFQEVGEDAL